MLITEIKIYAEIRDEEKRLRCLKREKRKAPGNAETEKAIAHSKEEIRRYNRQLSECSIIYQPIKEAKIMVKIEELRIGNYVKCKVSNDAAEYMVMALDGFSLRVMLNGVRKGTWYKEEKIRGILITAEKLQKFGFTKWNWDGTPALHIDCWQPGKNARFDLDYKEGKVYLKSRYEQENAHQQIDIKYIHQMQNLYFSLTGQELKTEE